MAGQNGINRISQEFRQIVFPGFTEHLLDLVKTYLTCLQLRNANKRHLLRRNLQPLSSLKSYPGDMLQRLFGNLFINVLSEIDVFAKSFFSVPEKVEVKTQYLEN